VIARIVCRQRTGKWRKEGHIFFLSLNLLRPLFPFREHGLTDFNSLSSFLVLFLSVQQEEALPVLAGKEDKGGANIQLQFFKTYPCISML
jgi:hypothetical protein